jgi:hypothetical protein
MSLIIFGYSKWHNTTSVNILRARGLYHIFFSLRLEDQRICKGVFLTKHSRKNKRVNSTF